MNQNPKPPAWVASFLGRFLNHRLQEACLGDLEEKFIERVSSGMSLRKARLLYCLEGIGFIKLAHGNVNSTITTMDMIKHILLFFVRLVRRDTSYYVVSLLGLTISVASFLFITMFINDELAYDQFHSNHNRIYRVATHLRLNDIPYDMATATFPAASAIQSEIAEVESTVRIYPQDLTIESGDQKFQEHVYFADNTFFNVFTFSFALGDAASAMREPASIILTQTTAKKYFGSENPIGKLLKTDQQELIVQAVIKDLPDQSHMKFDAIVPLTFQLNTWKSQSGIEGRENKWFWVGSHTYLLLKSENDLEIVQSKLPKVVEKYFPERLRTGGRYELQPLADIHLKSHLDSELEQPGSMMYIRLFSIVAFVIMIVSAINLINLSYFKISGRVREVGIRKFLGQSAARVIAQLSVESMLMGLIAFVFALLLCWSLVSQFNLLVDKKLSLWSAPNQMIITRCFVAIIAICLLAVLRPAIRYASRPASFLLLKNYHNAGVSQLRNVMIGIQVCFSFVLLVFSFIISNQVSFFKESDLGFNRENVIVVKMNQQIMQKFEAFKNELKLNKDIVDVAGAEKPGRAISGWRFVPQGGSYEKPVMLPFTSVDYGFLSTLEIALLEGVNFNPEGKYDSLAPFLINKRATIELGWQNDAIGKTLEIFAPGQTEIMMKGQVIGVFDDYHNESLHRPIKPLVLSVAPYFPEALIKLSLPPDPSSLAFISATWKRFSDKPFEYEVLSTELDKLYSNESKLGDVILFFTFIALYLTSYGLFAMSSLLFTSKLKEVAIRKIYGADQLTIIRQFYTRYAVFNLLAIIVGLPIAIYLGNLWLENFQYRIELSAAFFIKAGVYVLVAGLLSVSYYLARVAFSNPVKFLRNE